MGIQTDFAGHYHYTDTVKRSPVQGENGHFRTVYSLWNSTPPLLCTARGGKTNRSTCIKRSSQCCSASGDFQASCWNSLETLGFRIQGRFGLCHSVIFPDKENGFFSPGVFTAQQNLREESCRFRQLIASWLCTSRSLDTLGTFTRGQFWWTPTPSKTYPVLRVVKAPKLSVLVRAPHPPVAWDTNYPLTPCR